MILGINCWSVLLAAVANIILGFLWYGPFFGKKWMSLIGLSGPKMAPLKARGMGMPYTFMAITSIIMSFVLANLIVFAASYWFLGGAMLGIAVGAFVWLGFILPVTLGVVLWEGKSWKLWWINSMYYLIALCVMGTIIACW